MKQNDYKSYCDLIDRFKFSNLSLADNDYIIDLCSFLQIAPPESVIKNLICIRLDEIPLRLRDVVSCSEFDYFFYQIGDNFDLDRWLKRNVDEKIFSYKQVIVINTYQNNKI